MAKDKQSTEDLEKALDNIILDKKDNDSKTPEQVSTPGESVPKEEEIGFHKGAVNTLLAERTELVKMVGNVEAIMQMHLSRLKELGVDIQTQEPEKK